MPPYDVWFASNYGDDEPPNTIFADFAAEWNAKWAWPQFKTIGRLDEPFERLERDFGDAIPTLRGEMTSGWLQHAAAAPELLAAKLNADRALETAERLGAFAGTLDRAAIDSAWWHLILNDEHSYGTSGYQGRRVFLPSDAKRIDIEDTIEHARDLFNDNRWFRFGYLAFPFDVPGGSFAACLQGSERLQ